jgi:hypothetical protein
MRTILLALIWCARLVGIVTTRSDGGDNRVGQILQTELEAGDLAAVVAEQETTQQLLSYADVYPVGSKLRCALAYAARPTGPHGRRSKGCHVALSQKRYAHVIIICRKYQCRSALRRGPLIYISTTLH